MITCIGKNGKYVLIILIVVEDISDIFMIILS